MFRQQSKQTDVLMLYSLDNPMGMFIRYVEEARRTVVRAKHQADRFGSPKIEPEHILLALLDDPVLVSRTMTGISTRPIIETINARLPRREPNPLPHDLDLSTAAREALLLAEREADKLGHRHIQNGHLLLGLVESPHGSAAELLMKEGLTSTAFVLPSTMANFCFNCQRYQSLATERSCILPVSLEK